MHGLAIDVTEFPVPVGPYADTGPLEEDEMSSSISPREMAKKLHLSPMPIQIPGSFMWITSIELTPKLADDWLERYNNANRKSKKPKIGHLEADILAGMWIETHQAIAFDSDGEMTSGQHRCRACSRSGVPIKTLVIINCLPKERAAIDQAANRTPSEVAALGFNDEVSSLVIQTCRSLVKGNLRQKTESLTPQQVYQLVVTHRRVLDWVVNSVTKKVPTLTSAVVLGAIARAAYHIKKDRIQHFVQVLCSGLPETDNDKVIILLRNTLFAKGSLGNSYEERSNVWGLVEKALYFYENYEPCPSRLVGSKEEIYHMPATKQV